MKKFLKVIALMLVVAFSVSMIAGCGAKAPAAEPAKEAAKEEPKKEEPKKAEKIKMRASSFFTGGDTWTSVWQEGIKDYMAKNPNVEIVDDSTPAAGDAFKTKINTDFASGNEPDIVYGFTGAIGKPLVDSGKLMAWEDELAKDTEWSKNISKGALEYIKAGKQYAIPYIGFYEGMFYNKDLFEKHNVKVPTNWDELLAAVDAFNKVGITPIACSFAEEPHYIIETFLLSMGGKEGHDKPFDESWAPALDKIKELYAKKAFSKDALTIKQIACQQLMKDKKAAMFISGSWSAAALDGEKTSIMPVNLLPGGKAEPTSIIAGFSTGWYVTEALNKKTNGEAVKFVKFMTSTDRAAKFFKVGGVPAINTKVEGASPLFNDGVAMLNGAKVATGPVGDTMTQESFTTIWKGLAHVVTGKKTSTQLLDEAKKLAK
ncbi:MAG: extracellular solute-binding protein [Clostridia bacterium]|nr:extracellular solute-binding protein [Clostridia bacterium]